jgi:antirestriction protein ArdC
VESRKSPILLNRATADAGGLRCFPRAGTRLTQSALAARAGYAMEELVAEIGAAFLCADLGITPETRDDHAAYIAGALWVLRHWSARAAGVSCNPWGCCK